MPRSPPGPAKHKLSLSCWFPAMLAVTKLSGTKWLSPWVIFCAVACIGVGVRTGASSGSFKIAEVSGLSFGSDCFVQSFHLIENCVCFVWLPRRLLSVPALAR